jgi:hypothetical protein
MKKDFQYNTVWVFLILLMISGCRKDMMNGFQVPQNKIYESLHVKVVDLTTNNPLEGVVLRFNNYTGIIQELTTDREGRMKLVTPTGKSHVIAATKPGYFDIDSKKISLRAPYFAETETEFLIWSGRQISDDSLTISMIPQTKLNLHTKNLSGQKGRAVMSVHFYISLGNNISVLYEEKKFLTGDAEEHFTMPAFAATMNMLSLDFCFDNGCDSVVNVWSDWIYINSRSNPDINIHY